MTGLACEAECVVRHGRTAILVELRRIRVGVDGAGVRIVTCYASDRQVLRCVELFGLLVVACESSTGVERHRQFFRQVDAAFRNIAATDPLPLVVVGVDRYLAFFNEVSKHKNMIIATLPGNHDKTPAHEMATQVWPLVQIYLDRQRKDALKALDAAVSARKYASGIGEAWRAAIEGRGATLLVEDDFRYPAHLNASGLHLRPAEDSTASDVIDDAVDELIEFVLAQGGRVIFVDNGALATHQSIALILRY